MKVLESGFTLITREGILPHSNSGVPGQYHSNGSSLDLQVTVYLALG